MEELKLVKLAFSVHSLARQCRLTFLMLFFKLLNTPTTSLILCYSILPLLTPGLSFVNCHINYSLLHVPVVHLLEVKFSLFLFFLATKLPVTRIDSAKNLLVSPILAGFLPTSPSFQPMQIQSFYSEIRHLVSVEL